MNQYQSMHLSQNEIDLCEQYGVVIDYPNEATIQHRGDIKPGLSIVKTGSVKIGNYGADGKYFLTQIARLGDTFGEFTLLAELPRTHTAEAFGQCSLIQVSPANYFRLVEEHPQFQQKLFIMMSIKLHQALEALEDARRLPVITRVAKLILSETSTSSSQEVQVKQSDIAGLLGVTVLAVHKALQQLQLDGLVQLKYKRIEVNDVETLANWVNVE